MKTLLHFSRRTPGLSSTEVSGVCLSETYMNIQMLKADVRAMFKVAKPMVRSVGPSPMILAFALALLSWG